MPKTKSGFTITELLIVIAVIGILAAITIVAYRGIQNRSYDASVSSDLENIAKKIHMFSIIYDRFPKGATDLLTADVKVTRGAYSRGLYNGTSYYNLVYCWPNSANPTQFALVAESKSGNVFQYNANRVDKASYAYVSGSGPLCANASVPMDNGSDRDWFYDSDGWQSFVKS